MDFILLKHQRTAEKLTLKTQCINSNGSKIYSEVKHSMHIQKVQNSKIDNIIPY